MLLTFPDWRRLLAVGALLAPLLAPLLAAAQTLNTVRSWSDAVALPAGLPAGVWTLTVTSAHGYARTRRLLTE